MAEYTTTSKTSTQVPKVTRAKKAKPAVQVMTEQQGVLPILIKEDATVMEKL